MSQIVDISPGNLDSRLCFIQPKKIKSVTVSDVCLPICHEVMGPDAMLSFKPAFPISSFTFIKRVFSSSSISVIMVVSSAYLRLLKFHPEILIHTCASSSLAFHMMNCAYKLNKCGDILPWCTPFPTLNQSVVPCLILICFLTCIQVSQETGKVVWYSYLFKNFP